MKNDVIYAFDLDGTVTTEETLPLLANALGLQEEMELLTKLTLDGTIAFDQSFKLRFHILNGIPLNKIQKIMSQVRLDNDIAKFIMDHKENCAIVTGNLNYWIEPLAQKLGCRFYSSIAEKITEDRLELKKVLIKSEAIRDMKNEYSRVIAVGDSFNDVPMFEEADAAVAFGGVHSPVNKAIQNADYVVYKGDSLCKLLKML